VTKDGPLEAGLVHPSATAAADKLHVSSSSITKGVFLGKGRFGDVLEGFVTGNLNKIQIFRFHIISCVF